MCILDKNDMNRCTTHHQESHQGNTKLTLTVNDIMRVRQEITDDSLSDDELFSTDEEGEDSGEEPTGGLARLAHG